MIRRSTRIRTATKGAASVDESVSENDNEEIEKPTKRQKPRKKRSKPMWSRTSGPKKYVKGRRGALKELVEMPLDVLFEVRRFEELYGAGSSSYISLSDIRTSRYA